MTTKTLIPERGWHPMIDAAQDATEILVVRYHEHNKQAGPYRVQLAQWLPNGYGEFAWRPAGRPDGGTVYADGWMALGEYQRAAEELASEAAPEFDL